MNKYEELKNEIEELIIAGKDFNLAMKENSKTKEIPAKLFHDYENWYTKSLYVVKQICPERLEDFIRLYKLDKRKDIALDSFVISDALKGLKLVSYDTFSLLVRLLNSQINILGACLGKFDSKIFDMQAVLQADIFDSELESARHLLKKGFLRAAGAICGVVLEKHLGIVCSNRKISITKKTPTIADYNDKLKDIAYDVVEWRKIQRLGDIRNLCDHNKDREPTKDEVEELISGVEKVTKTIF